jgi:hypothetical protein
MTTPTLPQLANGVKAAASEPARPHGPHLGRRVPEEGLRTLRRAVVRSARPEEGRRGKLSKLASEALRYLGSVRNYAPTTLDNYEASFDQFHQFLAARGLPDDVQQFTGDNVRRFVESLGAKEQKASTIAPPT